MRVRNQTQKDLIKRRQRKVEEVHWASDLNEANICFLVTFLIRPYFVTSYGGRSINKLQNGIIVKF